MVFGYLGLNLGEGVMWVHVFRDGSGSWGGSGWVGSGGDEDMVLIVGVLLLLLLCPLLQRRGLSEVSLWWWL